MSVAYTILRADGTQQRGQTTKTDYATLAPLIRTSLGVDEYERVRCFVDDKLTDMFVDEMGHIRKNRPPLNALASRYYNALAIRNGGDGLYEILGDAIVFDEPVWDDAG